MTASYIKYGLYALIGPILTIIVLTIWILISKKKQDQFLNFMARQTYRLLPPKKRKSLKRKNKKRR